VKISLRREYGTVLCNCKNPRAKIGGPEKGRGRVRGVRGGKGKKRGCGQAKTWGFKTMNARWRSEWKGGGGKKWTKGRGKKKKKNKSINAGMQQFFGVHWADKRSVG